MDVSENFITQLRSRISFLRDYRVLPETRGHSRTPCFVLEKLSQKYFLKLYPTDRVKELNQIEHIYNSLQIPTAKIAQTSYISDLDLTFCIYAFIKGPTLRELLRTKPAIQLETIGRRTGQELSKFSTLPGDIKTFLPKLKQILTSILQNAHLQKRHYNQTHTRKLPKIDLHRLEKSLLTHLQAISCITPTFTHGDINLYNIILHDNIPYFIDTDGGHFSTRALDFRGNCWWGWTGNNTEREQAIFRGIYQGYFDSQIPESFHQELGFAIMYEFLLRLQRYQNIDEQTYYSFLRWHDILELTQYFENYHFSWF